MTAPNLEQLQEKIEQLLTIAPQLSKAEMADLSAELALGSWGIVDENQGIRAAVVASTPNILTRHLETLKSWLLDSSASDTPLRNNRNARHFSRQRRPTTPHWLSFPWTGFSGLSRWRRLGTSFSAIKKPCIKPLNYRQERISNLRRSPNQPLFCLP